MLNLFKSRNKEEKRQVRVRAKLHGTQERPRVSVHRTNEHMYAQVIDDDKAITLFSVSEAELKDKKMTKTERSVALAKLLAEKAKKQKVEAMVFDRGSFRYHGRVKAIADTLREQGIRI